METKFIKYKADQINLALMYRFGCTSELTSEDLKNGKLVVGYCSGGKYPAMGYLRGMSQSKETGEMLYEIANAVEGEEYSTCIKKPYKVDATRLPHVAAYPNNSNKPIVGRVIECNGELATIYDGSSKTVVNVNSIYELTPYFKDAK